MFKVWFQNVKNENNLTNDAVYLPAIPSVGEPVYIRERPRDRPQRGIVTSRQWHVSWREPENSEVVVLVQLD